MWFPLRNKGIYYTVLGSSDIVDDVDKKGKPFDLAFKSKKSLNLDNLNF